MRNRIERPIVKMKARRLGCEEKKRLMNDVVFGAVQLSQPIRQRCRRDQPLQRSVGVSIA
jgi:hypothetical protein